MISARTTISHAPDRRVGPGAAGRAPMHRDCVPPSSNSHPTRSRQSPNALPNSLRMGSGNDPELLHSLTQESWPVDWGSPVPGSTSTPKSSARSGSATVPRHACVSIPRWPLTLSQATAPHQRGQRRRSLDRAAPAAAPADMPGRRFSRSTVGIHSAVVSAAQIPHALVPLSARRRNSIEAH